MASPIYFFTRSGCIWCQKMKPSIDQINETLNDEQKIQIHSIDEKKSKVIYDSVIRMNNTQNVIPLMYNSNIGTTLLGYNDKKDIQKFLRAEPISIKQPLRLTIPATAITSPGLNESRQSNVAMSHSLPSTCLRFFPLSVSPAKFTTLIDETSSTKA